MDRRLIAHIAAQHRILTRVDRTKNARMTARTVLLTAGVLAGALLAAAPASADPADDLFLTAVDNAGVAVSNPGDAVALGQSVCPMLAQPGQTMADAASQVANAAGMPLGPATMFTGLAITAFCPGAVSALGNGESPIPLNLLGI